MSNTNGYLTHNVSRRLGRSAFNVSEKLAMSFEQGELTPAFVSEAYPKYTIRDAMSTDIELAPQVTPFKGRIHLTTSAWQIPCRILWEHWDKFINPALPDNHRKPTVTPFRILGALSTTAPASYTNREVRSILGPGTIWDYITKAPVLNASDLYVVGNDGVRAGDVEVDWLYFRAYYKVWFDNYRDANFIDEVESDMDPRWSENFTGAYSPQVTDIAEPWEIRSVFQQGTVWKSVKPIFEKMRPYKKAWRRDYFTSALPWPQRGQAVPIPGQSGGAGGVVVFDPTAGHPTFDPVGPETSGVANISQFGVASHTTGSFPDGTLLEVPGTQYATQTAVPVGYNPDGTLRVASSNEEESGALATMRDLTIAERIQRIFERAARSGTRLIEYLKGFWGTNNGDARLQRPEHLGAHTVDFDGSTVVQVSASNADSAQGNMSGYSKVRGRNLRHTSFMSEHSIVLYLIYAIPETRYHGGLARHFRKLTRYDLALPDFEDIGEQAIKQHEIYAPWMPGGSDGLSADQEFGYSPRYADLKCGISRVCGDFATSLAPWHQARMWHDPFPVLKPGGDPANEEDVVYEGSAPLLNRTFIESDPSKRIFPSQVVGDDVIWADLLLERKIVMPFRRFVLPKLS